jgi:hypothetical protein
LDRRIFAQAGNMATSDQISPEILDRRWPLLIHAANDRE